MAGQAQAANAAAKRVVEPAFTMHSLWRIALWGITALTALLVAILTTRSDAGAQRPAAAGATQGASRQFDAEAAARQLAQAVRGLSEDRDRLVTRLAAIEHSLDDITGAIARRGESVTPAAVQGANPTEVSKPANAPAVGAPAANAGGDNPAAANTAAAPPSWPPEDRRDPGTASSAAAAPAAVPPFAGTPSSLPALFAAPPPFEQVQSAAASTSGPTPPAAYGADLGSAVSIQALRARWAGTRSAHPQLFAGLQAVVMLNETQRAKHAELRLVVGPLPSPGAAVELCATLATFRLSCQPTSFAGEHLALQ